MDNNDIHSRLLTISDIHGHTLGLHTLLRKAGYKPEADRLILLGDYVDADPATYKALAAVKELVDKGARAILGNQETALLKNQSRRLAAEVAEWLQSLPLYIEEENYLFVHAGIRPGIPMSDQSASDLTEIREKFWEVPALELSRIVIFGHTPTFKLGAAHGRLWFGNGRIGIDTGAKHGCRLTLLDVSGGIAYSCSTAPDNLYEDYREERFA